MTAPVRLLAPYLDRSQVDPLALRIVERTLVDMLICETPAGSNRGKRIDEYNLAAGAALGSPHCASTVAAWYRESGAATPGKYKEPSCDEWMKWAKANGSWSSRPVLGAVVVYGVPGDARHVGVVVRIIQEGGQLRVYSVEGNTSDGGGFEREGYIIFPKRVDQARVLGYIHPRAA